MGLYDTIRIFLNCPYCGKTVTEAQTKDLGSSMSTYDTVPNFEIKYLTKKLKTKKDKDWYECFTKRSIEKAKISGVKKVNITADCRSVSCQFDADRRDLISQSCPSGFGRIFEADLPVIKGALVSRLDNVELDGYNEKYFASYIKKKGMKAKLNKILKKYKNQEVIAVRNWGRESMSDSKEVQK